MLQLKVPGALQGGSSIAPGTSVGTRKSVSSIEGPHSIPPLFPLRVLCQAPVPSSSLGDCSHPSLQPVSFYPPKPHPGIPSLCCLGPALSPSSCFLPSWVCLGTEMLKAALSLDTVIVPYLLLSRDQTLSRPVPATGSEQ